MTFVWIALALIALANIGVAISAYHRYHQSRMAAWPAGTIAPDAQRITRWRDKEWR